jgi:hypothetical protein
VATFCDANVGANKTVTATNFCLSGTAAANYALVSSTATASASIIPPQAPTVTLSLNPDGSARLDCSGAAGQTFFIQASSDLNGSWSTISTNVLDGGGLASVNDAGQAPSRFYRTMTSF